MSPLLLVAATLCLSAPPSPETARAEYQSKKSQVARTADAQVELALWCESKGLLAERDTHLAHALLRDPQHATARGLLGQVYHDGRWQRHEAVAEMLRTDADWNAKRVAYEAKRLKAPVEPDAQWRLAKWCIEEGLEREAKAHLNAVVKLDPEHEAARKKLGYKRVDGRWLTPEEAAFEKADAAAQRAADRRWESELPKQLRALRDGKPGRKNAALDSLAQIHDPRAVPTVWRLLIAQRDGDHVLGAQLLGQIDSPASSRALASLAAFDAIPEARRAAAETLRSRDPREYADILIGLIRDPIRFEVRGEGTASAPKRLFIEGQDRNFERIYLPPPFLQPGDVLTFDPSGTAIVRRSLYAAQSRQPKATSKFKKVQVNSFDFGGPVSEPASPFENVGFGPIAGYGPMEAARPVNTGFLQTLRITPSLIEASQGRRDWRVSLFANYTVEQLFRDQKLATEALAKRMEGEVAALESANREIWETNQRIVGILQDATKMTAGADREQWKKWWVSQIGYAYMAPITTPKETVSEMVTAETRPRVEPLSYTTVVATYEQISCFAAGTPVSTISGLRPIESLRPGDLVLTLDQTSGSLRYQPILVTHHNPPSTTVRITTGDETIASSDFHRFWKPGTGWVMARDLKVGDRLRTSSGIRVVTSLSTGPKEPVYNLDVAGDANFFVGKSSLLVHDNTVPNFRDEPYDRPATAVVRKD